MPPVSSRSSARPAVPRRSAAAAPTALQQRKRQLVKQEIAHAAWLLFAERGYEKATVEAIARAAGVSRRSFFRYFSSKEDVVVGTSDALAEDVLAGFAQPPEARADARRDPARDPAGDRDPPRRRGRVPRHREPAAREPDPAPGHARAPRAPGGAPRGAASPCARGADPRRDPTPALLAFLARALLDTAFNVWYDQRPKDVGAMIDDLFRRLRTVVGSPRRGARRAGEA